MSLHLSSQKMLMSAEDFEQEVERKHNKIGDQPLTEGAVYFRRGGIVLQDATGATLGTTI